MAELEVGEYKLKPGDIVITELEKKETGVQTEVKSASDIANRVSKTYEEFNIMSLLSPSLTEFSPEGKLLFELIHKDLLRELDRMSDQGAFTMEDWRSVDWKKILPPGTEPAKVNNKAIFLMFKAHLTDYIK